MHILSENQVNCVMSCRWYALPCYDNRDNFNLIMLTVWFLFLVGKLQKYSIIAQYAKNRINGERGMRLARNTILSVVPWLHFTAMIPLRLSSSTSIAKLLREWILVSGYVLIHLRHWYIYVEEGKVIASNECRCISCDSLLRQASIFLWHLH